MNPDERPNTIKSHLVALSTVAVLTVYAAGYLRTRAAAERIASEATAGRPAVAIARAATGELPTPDSAAKPVVHDSLPALAGDINPRHVDRAPSVPASPVRAISKDSALPATATTAPVPVQVIDSSKASPAPAAVIPEPVPATDTSIPASAGGADSAAHTADRRGQFKDGFYSGWGTSRHGDIEASVEIKNGRIISASITQCLTRYSCSWIAELPPQVLARQSAGVDYVSGATQSSDAFSTAIAEALAKAK